MVSVKRFLIRILYYYSLAIGITAYYYDLRRCRRKRGRILKYYTILMNLLVLCILPWYWYEAKHYFDLLYQNPLLHIQGFMQGSFQVLMTVCAIAMRFRTDKEFANIIRALYKIEKQLKPMQIKRNAYYSTLFYLKYFTLCGQSMTLLFGFILVGEKRSVTYRDILCILYFMVIWYYLHCILFFYFLVLLHICRSFKMLSVELNRILADSLLETNIALVLNDLKFMLRLHRKLQYLVLQVTELFGTHVILFLTVFILQNVSIGYMTFLFVTMVNFSRYVVIFGVLAYAMKYFHVYLLMVCCEEIVQLHGESAQILQMWMFNLPQCDLLHRMVEEFQFQQSIHQLRINIYGMFSINKRAAFLILSETVMHSIIFTQFDYLLK